MRRVFGWMGALVIIWCAVLWAGGRIPFLGLGGLVWRVWVAGFLLSAALSFWFIFVYRQKDPQWQQGWKIMRRRWKDGDAGPLLLIFLPCVLAGFAYLLAMFTQYGIAPLLASTFSTGPERF